MSEYTTTQKRDSLIQMFIDNTSDEVYASGRLATVKRGGKTLLVAYGQHVLAQADGNTIDLFTGHHSEHSRAVTVYVKRLGSILNDYDNREVHTYEDRAPDIGPNSEVKESAKYIGHYVNFTTAFSAVEKDAVKEVEAALTRRMAQIFG